MYWLSITDCRYNTISIHICVGIQAYKLAAVSFPASYLSYRQVNIETWQEKLKRDKIKLGCDGGVYWIIERHIRHKKLVRACAGACDFSNFQGLAVCTVWASMISLVWLKCFTKDLSLVLYPLYVDFSYPDWCKYGTIQTIVSNHFFLKHVDSVICRDLYDILKFTTLCPRQSSI